MVSEFVRNKSDWNGREQYERLNQLWTAQSQIPHRQNHNRKAQHFYHSKYRHKAWHCVLKSSYHASMPSVLLYFIQEARPDNLTPEFLVSQTRGDGKPPLSYHMPQIQVCF